jgi:CDP-diacylglycerol---glycerol-3-phosphate 3-phosphatidyltransferase
MKALNEFIEVVRSIVRHLMDRLAALLNQLSKGRLSPNMVTYTSLAAHVLIAWLIATKHPFIAAASLVVFGLFDALDGALARQQQRANVAGMLLDATTDRMKEVLLYAGVAYWFINGDHPGGAVWAVLACGCSLLVSYVKAKGETVVAKTDLSASQVNHLFADGLMRYEIRMVVLILGLLTNTLLFAVILITILSGATAVGRLVKISHKIT